MSTIPKNLLSVSQFARENNVYFEYHPFHCLIKDEQTQEVLLRGDTHRGLYRFFPAIIDSTNEVLVFTLNAKLGFDHYNNTVFNLWHRRLGHPSRNIVQFVLNTCNVAVNNNKCDHVCCCELVVSDLWGPVAVVCGSNWYYVSFIDMFS